MESSTIILTSSDDQNTEVSEELMSKYCSTIKRALLIKPYTENNEIDKNTVYKPADEDQIFLINIQNEHLKKIIELLSQIDHTVTLNPRGKLVASELQACIEKWLSIPKSDTQENIRIMIETIRPLIEAATYLGSNRVAKSLARIKASLNNQLSTETEQNKENQTPKNVEHDKAAWIPEYMKDECKKQHFLIQNGLDYPCNLTDWFVSNPLPKISNGKFKIEFAPISSLNGLQYIENSSNIHSLVCSSNCLRHLKIKYFINFSHLDALTIRNNPVSIIHPSTFRPLSNLSKLAINWTHISEISTFLHPLKCLKTLDLSSNQIEKIHPNAFNPLNSVIEIVLSLNKIVDIAPNTFCLENLASLWLNNNQIKQFNHHWFDNAPNLKEVVFGGNMHVPEQEKQMHEGYLISRANQEIDIEW